MAKKEPVETATQETLKKKCGIVMPIAGFDGYSSDHWLDVKEIIGEAAGKAGFEPNLVSYTDETSVIHKTIIQNLYDNEIVVVDVSGKNPNVMFELGIRLTFDKPTIIIKDDKTNYIFDTGIIDHLVYPADLHYQSIIKFKEQLTKKIIATYDKSQGEHYSSFLKNFGEFTVSTLEKTELPQSEFILKAINELKSEVRSLKLPFETTPRSISNQLRFDIRLAWGTFKREKDILPEVEMTPTFLKSFENWIKEYDPSLRNELDDLSAKTIIDFANRPPSIYL